MAAEQRYTPSWKRFEGHITASAGVVPRFMSNNVYRLRDLFDVDCIFKKINVEEALLEDGVFTREEIEYFQDCYIFRNGRRIDKAWEMFRKLGEKCAEDKPDYNSPVFLQFLRTLIKTDRRDMVTDIAENMFCGYGYVKKKDRHGPLADFLKDNGFESKTIKQRF